MDQVFVIVTFSTKFLLYCSFSLSARERIARASGKSVDDVGKLLYFYKQTKIVATWLQLKKSKKEKIPEVQSTSLLSLSYCYYFILFSDSRRNATNARDRYKIERYSY
jgi:hypothetical protein